MTYRARRLFSERPVWVAAERRALSLEPARELSPLWSQRVEVRGEREQPSVLKRPEPRQ